MSEAKSGSNVVFGAPKEVLLTPSSLPNERLPTSEPKSGSDIVFAVPEGLITVSRSYSEKAEQLLTMHYDLDTNLGTLHNSLPEGGPRLSLDTFWVKWSKHLLALASELESIAVLLCNSAIEYLNADKQIIKAFHGDKAEQDKIDKEIKELKVLQKEFQNDYNIEKKDQDDLEKQQDKEQKNQVKHVGEEKAGGDNKYHMENVQFQVDEDGKITQYEYNPWKVKDGKYGVWESKGQVDKIQYDGYWVYAGSQEAKNIHNMGDSDPQIKNHHFSGYA